MKKATLVFPQSGDKLLLGIKQKKISAGKFTGYGGRREGLETMNECAIRECNEEAGLIIQENNLIPVAIIHFFVYKKGALVFEMLVYTYIATTYTGELRDTDEMKSHTLFPQDNLPVADMLDDNQHFLPRILKGEKLIGEIHTHDGIVTLDSLVPTNESEITSLFKHA